MVALVLRPKNRSDSRIAPSDLDCSPSLDQVAGLFPASSGQRGPYATDRSISSIGALLPIEL